MGFINEHNRIGYQKKSQIFQSNVKRTPQEVDKGISSAVFEERV